jgi:hypothetical protein
MRTTDDEIGKFDEPDSLVILLLELSGISSIVYILGKVQYGSMSVIGSIWKHADPLTVFEGEEDVWSDEEETELRCIEPSAIWH